jgi:hypothetical protein
MKNGKTNVLTPMWLKAQALIKENKMDEADDALMTLIFKISDYTLDGHNDEYKIEGVKKGVWYERAWTAIEVNGLLPA